MTSLSLLFGLFVCPRNTHLHTSFCLLFSRMRRWGTLTLNAGDLIIFRGDLSHAGAAYEEDNVRVHVYIDSPLYPREPGETFYDPVGT